MKRLGWILAIALAWLLPRCGGGGGGPIVNAQQPVSQQLHVIDNVGHTNAPITCQNPGPPNFITWTNTTGAPIYVVSGFVWIGENVDGVSDDSIKLWDSTSGDVFIRSNWDHYANPTCADCNLLRFNAAPNYFLVQPNDVITLQYACTGPYTSVPATVAAVFNLYYVTNPN